MYTYYLLDVEETTQRMDGLYVILNRVTTDTLEYIYTIDGEHLEEQMMKKKT